ncbi:MAG: alpha/beta hydrolase [Pirellulales bacterium]
MRWLSLAVLVLFADSAAAAEMSPARDIAYAEPRNERHLLDVYANGKGSNRPVIFWIHGGGWRRGDKGGVQIKPKVFTDRGYVFVSANYRFVPDVNIAQMTGDIAKAIRWTHDHAGEYGGDGKQIVVMGHSAGAHLAALVCTDDSYLKADGLSLEIIKGCVPLDVSVYDIPARHKVVSEQRILDAYKLAFGVDEAGWRKYPPAYTWSKTSTFRRF